MASGRVVHGARPGAGQGRKKGAAGAQGRPGSGRRGWGKGRPGHGAAGGRARRQRAALAEGRAGRGHGARAAGRVGSEGKAALVCKHRT